jgi:hypothetical protein
MEPSSIARFRFPVYIPDVAYDRFLGERATGAIIPGSGSSHGLIRCQSKAVSLATAVAWPKLQQYKWQTPGPCLQYNAYRRRCAARI